MSISKLVGEGVNGKHLHNYENSASGHWEWCADCRCMVTSPCLHNEYIHVMSDPRISGSSANMKPSNTACRRTRAKITLGTKPTQASSSAPTAGNPSVARSLCAAERMNDEPSANDSQLAR